jgi:hypothetical protein
MWKTEQIKFVFTDCLNPETASKRRLTIISDIGNEHKNHTLGDNAQDLKITKRVGMTIALHSLNDTWGIITPAIKI